MAGRDNLAVRFRRAALHGQDECALRLVNANGASEITWRRLLCLSDEFASGFANLGIAQGGIIAIHAASCSEVVAMFWGAMQAGFWPSFMPPLSPRQNPGIFWETHQHLYERIAPALVLAHGPTLDEAKNRLSWDVRSVSDPGLRCSSPPGPCEASLNDVAFLQHSSGTTGLKKGVPITHGAALRQLDTYWPLLDFKPGDRVVSWLPLYHDMGLVACLLMPLSTGIPVTLIDPFLWVAKPWVFFDEVETSGGTHTWMPNFALRHLTRAARDPRRDLSTLRVVVNCSEPCQIEAVEEFCAVFAPWGLPKTATTTCYAMAETVFAVTQPPLDGFPTVLEIDRQALEEQSRIVPGRDLRLISSGVPLPGVHIDVLSDHDGSFLPEGEIGQLAIRAPFLFSGYNQLMEETARKLQEGKYLTGDRGFIINGEVWVLGRLDDVLIINGRKLHAFEIEAALCRVAGLRPGRVACFDQWLPEMGSHGLVIVAEHTDDGTDPGQLARSIREHVYGVFAVMPHHVRIEAPGWLIKTTSGKLARKEIRRKHLEFPENA